jgi:site-specific recombinase XerD
LRIAYCAIKFFYLHVVRRDWHILNILKAQSERRLPAVLTREEIDSIFQQIKGALRVCPEVEFWSG